MVSSANNQRDFTEAMVAFWQGDYVEAVRLFNQVAAAQPQDTAVKLLLASAQKQAGQLLEARHTYDTILKTASDPEELESARRGLEELLQMAPELADVPSPAQEDTLQPQGEFPPQPEEADPFSPV
jgi:twitching motility protein PilJ